MKEIDIRKAYATIRTTNNTIPDDVLNFMKDSALAQLKRVEDWIQVDGVDKVPKGTWFVKLEKESALNLIHIIGA